ncbi:UNVERIFIED_CONTAM: hypothetical protein K2H54_055947 [Gekko kuhli]
MLLVCIQSIYDFSQEIRTRTSETRIQFVSKYHISFLPTDDLFVLFSYPRSVLMEERIPVLLFNVHFSYIKNYYVENTVMCEATLMTHFHSRSLAYLLISYLGSVQKDKWSKNEYGGTQETGFVL